MESLYAITEARLVIPGAPDMYTRFTMGRRVLWTVLFILLAVLPAGAGQDPARALDLITPSRQRQAKDFKVSSLDGGTLRLSELRGKVVLLNLWATWCEPCKEEMPAMERLWRRYKAQGLVVVALSMDAQGAKVVKPFIDKARFSYPVGLDPRMEVAQLYGARAVPATFIIDRSGNLYAFALGPREWDSKSAASFFDSLLGQDKPRG